MGVLHIFINNFYSRTTATIRLGSLSYQTGGQVVVSKHFKIHPKYDPTNLDNDIALLYLPWSKNTSYLAKTPKGAYTFCSSTAYCERLSSTEEKQVFSTICLPRSYLEVQLLLHNRRFQILPLLQVVGWGQLSEDEPKLSPSLQSITVASISISTCHRMYSENVLRQMRKQNSGNESSLSNSRLLTRFTAPGADRRILCAHWPGKAICLVCIVLLVS